MLPETSTNSQDESENETVSTSNSNINANNYLEWSKEELVDEIKKLKRRRKYGIVWEAKSENVVTDCRIKLPVLKEDKEKLIETNIQLPVNILIEGDNFHSLSVLNFTHENAIDLIFIDPPYNTGNGDFVYNDNIVDRNDSYRHSKWLSFMNNRLKLAKNLLKDSGTIFITIDDNEVAQLKLLCDSIFGESNLVGMIIWKHRFSVSNDLVVSQNHNYILVYTKDLQKLFKNRRSFRLAPDLKGFSNPDDDPRGEYKLTPVDGPGGARKGNPHYEFLGISGYWRYSKETMQELYDDGRIVRRGKSLAKKYFLSDARKSGGKVATTWWDDAGTTTEGTRQLNEIIGKNKFNNPKPVRLLKRIIELATDNSSLILDFFAGSGTTGQAVLELNADSDSNRRFILCTDNENNIASNVCYPRLSKVINGYTKQGSEEDSEQVFGVKGNLKYYQTDFVSSADTDIAKKKLVDRSTEILCIRENCFDLIADGVDYKIFSNFNSDFLGIVYEDDGIDNIKAKIEEIGKKVSIYVFSLDNNAKEDQFSDLGNLVELRPIPASILNVYRRLFK